VNKPDYDNPQIDANWCKDQRVNAEAYLKQEKLTHGKVGEYPAWHVAPYLAVWAVESIVSPGAVGWWVITGDLPSDYLSSNEADGPRGALVAFSIRWNILADCIENGLQHRSIRLGSAECRPTLAPLLRSRAKLLGKFSTDGSLWEL
jgi:hypothetical protein